MALTGSTALTLLVSVWFVLPVPLLAAAAYAVVLGMAPSRFLDALQEPASGTSTQFPF